MAGNWHVWAEAQEVTFVGLLILGAVRDRAHTSDWKQRLTGNQRSRLGRDFSAETTYCTYGSRTTVPCAEPVLKTGPFLEKNILVLCGIAGENTHTVVLRAGKYVWAKENFKVCPMSRKQQMCLGKNSKLGKQTGGEKKRKRNF